MIHPELPHNIEAENAVLGCVLQHPDALTPIAPWLKAEYFYGERNAWIYEAMLACQRQGKAPYSPSVVIELKKAGRESAASVLELEVLSDSVPSWLAVEDYAHEVERCAVLRSVIAAGGKIAAVGYAETDADAAIGSMHKLTAGVALRRAGNSLLSSAAAADLEYARMERANAGQPPVSGVSTGFRDIDEILTGLSDSDLVIVAARPSVGKTAFLLGLAHGIAQNNADRDVLIFSLEMSEDQLRYRRLAMLSRIDTTRIRLLRLSESEQDAYMSALSEMASMPIHVDETPGASVAHIRNTAYRYQAQAGRKLVIFVDYIQLMTATGANLENRVQVVSEISRSLKALAKEMHCPVVALSQLSRAVEGRNSHVPILSDLRETGSIEQDGDVVMFIYREEMYDKLTDKKGIAEIHIAKHRNGPTGVVPMRFDAATTSFQTLTYRQEDY